MSNTIDVANLILDLPASGNWNMAVDQALLLTADQTGQATLRFYRWETATLSLGYFQKIADRAAHPESLSCPAVRRASGGGAILHDRELTFSLALPSANRWSKKNNDLYLNVHRCIAGALQCIGVNAELQEKRTRDAEAVQTDDSIVGRSANSFLCFQRRTDGDLILDGHKVGGSAQRRSKNAILQHTSLLLRKSHAAPELAGIEDLSGNLLDESALLDDLAGRLSKMLAVSFEPASLTWQQTEMAKKICDETFGNESWLTKK